MAQRSEPWDSLDHFPTPPWSVRALCEWMKRDGIILKEKSVWESACGEGHMARGLSEYFASVYASDIHDYGFGAVHDFLDPTLDRNACWIITNPPFKLAEEFVQIGFGRALDGVAIFERTNFLESVGRYKNLFLPTPPTDILQFVERVPLFKGRLNKEGSTATAYCWIVWNYERMHQGTRFHWIPPCRKRLEKDSDYL
jgi:hypothetical protein